MEPDYEVITTFGLAKNNVCSTKFLDGNGIFLLFNAHTGIMLASLVICENLYNFELELAFTNHFFKKLETGSTVKYSRPLHLRRWETTVHVIAVWKTIPYDDDEIEKDLDILRAIIAGTLNRSSAKQFVLFDPN